MTSKYRNKIRHLTKTALVLIALSSVAITAVAAVVFTLVIHSSVTVVASPGLQMFSVANGLCTTTVVTSISFGTVPEGQSATFQMCLNNNGGSVLFINPGDISSTLSGSVGIVSWNLASQISLSPGANSAVYTITLTIATGAALTSYGFDITISAHDCGTATC